MSISLEGSQFYLVISANSLEKLTLPRRKKKKCRMAKIKEKHAPAARKETQIFRAVLRLLMERLGELIKRHCQGCGLKPRRCTIHTRPILYVYASVYAYSVCSGALIYPRANKKAGPGQELV